MSRQGPFGVRDSVNRSAMGFSVRGSIVPTSGNKLNDQSDEDGDDGVDRTDNRSGLGESAIRSGFGVSDIRSGFTSDMVNVQDVDAEKSENASQPT